jgi:hypothetical protein
VLFPSREVYTEAKDRAQLSAVAELLRRCAAPAAPGPASGQAALALGPAAGQEPPQELAPAVVLQLVPPALLANALALAARVAARRPAQLAGVLAAQPRLLAGLARVTALVYDAGHILCPEAPAPPNRSPIHPATNRNPIPRCHVAARAELTGPRAAPAQDSQRAVVELVTLLHAHAAALAPGGVLALPGPTGAERAGAAGGPADGAGAAAGAPLTEALEEVMGVLGSHHLAMRQLASHRLAALVAGDPGPPPAPEVTFHESASATGAPHEPGSAAAGGGGVPEHNHMDSSRLGPLFWEECLVPPSSPVRRTRPLQGRRGRQPPRPALVAPVRLFRRADAGGLSGRQVPEQGLERDGPASVVYCCDRCGKQPVVGRRWHCRVCKDFDLCDACAPPQPHRIPPTVQTNPPTVRTHPPPSHVACARPLPRTKVPTRARPPRPGRCYRSIRDAAEPEPRAEQRAHLLDAWLYPPGADPADEAALMKLAVAISLEREPQRAGAASSAALAAALLRALADALPALAGPPDAPPAAARRAEPALHLSRKLAWPLASSSDGVHALPALARALAGLLARYDPAALLHAPPQVPQPPACPPRAAAGAAARAKGPPAVRTKRPRV